MTNSNPPHGASAISLIAITAGTVSAALLIMFIGLFLTIMSIGPNPQGDMQVTASRAHNHLRDGDMQMANAAVGKFVYSAKNTQKVKKGHIMDALLRDEVNRHPANSSEQHAQSPATVTRLIAITATPLPPAQASTLQI